MMKNHGEQGEKAVSDYREFVRGGPKHSGYNASKEMEDYIRLTRSFACDESEDIEWKGIECLSGTCRRHCRVKCPPWNCSCQEEPCFSVDFCPSSTIYLCRGVDDSIWLEYGAFHELSHFFQRRNNLDFDAEYYGRKGNFKSFRQTLWDLAVDRILLQFPLEWVAGGGVIVSDNPNPVPDFIRGKVYEVRKHYYERPNPDKVTDFDHFFHFLLWYSVNVALKSLCDYNPPQDQWTFATEALQSWHTCDAKEPQTYTKLCDALLGGFYGLRGD